MKKNESPALLNQVPVRRDQSGSQPETHEQRSIDLQIDELVLDGFSDADRYEIGEAVERELTRLFTEQGVPSAITFESETAELCGVALETNSTGDAIGARVARAIYGGLD